MRPGRYTVVQVKTTDCWLMVALDADAPHREVEGKTVPIIELGNSRLFPINGNGTYYEGGGSLPMLFVTLAESPLR